MCSFGLWSFRVTWERKSRKLSAKKPFTPYLDSLSFFKLVFQFARFRRWAITFRPIPYRETFSTAEEPATLINSTTKLHDSELNSLLCEILPACVQISKYADEVKNITSYIQILTFTINGDFIYDGILTENL